MCYGSNEFLNEKRSADAVDSSVATLAPPTNQRYAQPVTVNRSHATLADLRGNDVQADDVLDFYGLSDREKLGVQIAVSHLKGAMREHVKQFSVYIPSITRFTPVQVAGIILDALSVEQL